MVKEFYNSLEFKVNNNIRAKRELLVWLLLKFVGVGEINSWIFA